MLRPFLSIATFLLSWVVLPCVASAHDADLPQWVRESKACILDLYAGEGFTEAQVDLRRDDVLAVLGEEAWDEEGTPVRMGERILRDVRLDGRAPESVTFLGPSTRYEQWRIRWPAPLPEKFEVQVGLFEGLEASGWCQIFVVPDIGGVPERSFFFEGGKAFHWPRTITMPGMNAWKFFQLGFVHILPRGLDHILFVLGLCLAAARLGRLLIQVTAFTAAHTLTLGLAAKGVVSLPPAVIEPLIAVSIVWVAVENLRAKEPPPWRWAVVFAFGFLHGLGFAGVLMDSGLPAGAFISSLVAFNLGVEAGQLTVVAAALALLWRFRNYRSYRKNVLAPASLAIALVGVFWTMERVFRGFFGY